MAQWSGMLTALTEEPGSVSSAFIRCLITSYNSDFRWPDAVFWPPHALQCAWYTYDMQVYICMNKIRKHKIYKENCYTISPLNILTFSRRSPGEDSLSVRDSGTLLSTACLCELFDGVLQKASVLWLSPFQDWSWLKSHIPQVNGPGKPLERHVGEGWSQGLKSWFCLCFWILL